MRALAGMDRCSLAAAKRRLEKFRATLHDLTLVTTRGSA